MLTLDGQALVWELMKGRVAKIEITDGGKNRAAAAVTSAVATPGGLVVEAIFKADEANFDWKVSRVIDKNNKIIDEQVKDSGRKVAGGVWTAIVELAWTTA